MEKLILKWPEVQTTIGLKRNAINDLIKTNQFPKPVRLSKQRVGFVADEVREWVESRDRVEG